MGYDGNVEYDDELWQEAQKPLRNHKVIRCQCGKQVELLSGWANECEKCEREYNGSGQLLAPRSQWGEETGEGF